MRNVYFNAGDMWFTLLLGALAGAAIGVVVCAAVNDAYYEYASLLQPWVP